MTSAIGAFGGGVDWTQAATSSSRTQESAFELDDRKDMAVGESAPVSQSEPVGSDSEEMLSLIGSGGGIPIPQADGVGGSDSVAPAAGLFDQAVSAYDANSGTDSSSGLSGGAEALVDMFGGGGESDDDSQMGEALAAAMLFSGP